MTPRGKIPNIATSFPQHIYVTRHNPHVARKPPGDSTHFQQQFRLEEKIKLNPLTIIIVAIAASVCVTRFSDGELSTANLRKPV